MVFLLIAILSLGLLAAILSMFRPKREESPEPGEAPLEMECCGAHDVCEKESLMAAASNKIEYFDDVELDGFKHISPERYSDEQINAFRMVFETLPEDEVAAWIRSLHLRNIQLPNELKDEVLLIVGERRNRG